MGNPKVRLLGDPCLRQKARPVSQEEMDSLQPLIDTMLEVMKEEQGIGLAANQIGDERSLFVLGIGGLNEHFINPSITANTELLDFEEGCLSIPGTTAKTKRYNKITLTFHRLGEGARSESYEGLKAIAIQHELDHLNGKLYIDQFGPLKRTMVVDKHKKYLRLSRRT